MNHTSKATMMLLLLVPLFATGTACGDEERATGVASALSERDTATASPSDEPSTDNAQIAYARCLRDHGVEVADPAPGESVKIEGAKTPTLRVALEACRTLAPASELGDKLDPAQLLAYSVCIRANGFPEFPDPDAEGELLIPKSVVRMPAFEAAERVCAGQLGKPSGETTGK